MQTIQSYLLSCLVLYVKPNKRLQKLLEKNNQLPFKNMGKGRHFGAFSFYFYAITFYFYTMNFLIVGLGNIGKEYADTRHNIGFMISDELANQAGASWSVVIHAYYTEFLHCIHQVYV